MQNITGKAAEGGRKAIARTSAALTFLVAIVRVTEMLSDEHNIKALDNRYPIGNPKAATRRLTKAIRRYDADRFSIIRSATFDVFIAMTHTSRSFEIGLDRGASSFSILSLQK